MFEHAYHDKIFHVLKRLDASIFHEIGACFGGGTLVTLLHGEYRLSKGVDFICLVGRGYYRLRELVAKAGFKPSLFFGDTDSLVFPRETRADQYGVRFLVESFGVPIKFEIIAEARIMLDSPEKKD
jgi:hypothetical protein